MIKGVLPALTLLFASAAQGVVFEKAATYRNQVPACGDFAINPPPAVTSFATTDTAVALIFSVTGHRAGDIASVDYVTPSGSLYTPASGAWDPVTAAEASYQRFCFTDDMMRIAGTQAATLTGTWQIRIYYNGGLLTTLSFTIGTGGGGGGTVTTARWIAGGTYRDLPASCDAVVTGSTPVVTTFAVTDPGLALVIALGNVQVGDAAQADYINPSGLVYASAKWDPAPTATAPGTSRCFSDTGFKISGTQAAGMPGQWTIRLTVNQTAVGTMTFTIGGGSSSCTVTISPASAQVGAAAGSGSIAVTAPAGCQWTASSNAPSWISLLFGVSGSGNGSVPYNYTANTSASSRTGTITIDGQTFTLTQAGSGGSGGGGSTTGLPARPAGAAVDSSSPLAANLVGLFLMNESSGSSTRNVVNGQSASFAGTAPPTWNTSDPSVVFNGGALLNSFANAGTDAQFDRLPTSPMTLVAKVWVNKLAAAGVCEKNDANAVDGFVFGWDSDGALRLTVEKPSLNMRVVTAAGAVPQGQWVQVAATWDGTVGTAAAARLYVNGVEQVKAGASDGSGSLGYAGATNQPFRIGNASFDPMTASLNGKMAYLAVYRGRILTAAELKALDSQLPITGSGGSSCTYSISPGSAQVGAGAGSGSVTVTAGSGCGWSATSNAPTWLTVTAGASGSGNGTVSYSYTANSSANSRTGTITIDGQTFTLTQAGAPAGVCAVSISPGSAQVVAAAGSGQVRVTSDCGWTAASNAPSWLTVTAGASGSGNSTVSYSYTANTSANSRNGTITIGNQTFTLTQAGSTTGGCTFDLGYDTISVPASGKTGTIYITTAAGCAWTASTSAAWLAITSETSGKGSGSVKYSAAANKAQARTATLTVVNKSITFTQAEAPAKPPAAAVMNAASRMPNTLPGGGIAPGSVFSVFSLGMGPDAPVTAAGFPLSKALAGTTVRVTVAGSGYDAWPVLSSNTQVDAVLPSAAPEGDATVVVTYNGKATAAFPFRVRRRSFGAFASFHGNGPAKLQLLAPGSDPVWASQVTTAQPGQDVALWGTGLGPGDTPDDQTASTLDMSADVVVTVGGKTATVLSAGRSPDVPGNDIIRFTLAQDTPTGCYVPVQVNIGAVYSNSVTMAVSADGGACSDPRNPYSNVSQNGRKGGTIFLLRGNFVGVTDPKKGLQDVTLDMGIGLFLSTPAGGEQAYNPMFSLPPLGTCSSYTGTLDSKSSSGTSQQSGVNALGKPLHAGKTLTVIPPKGQSQPLEGPDDNEPAGGYSGFLGGNVPSNDKKVLPLFFDAGRYRVTGPGGRDVGPFDVAVDIPAPMKWTNRDEMTAVDRSAPLTYRWSGGNSSQIAIVGAMGTDQDSKVTSGFYCFVPSEPGQFTVPQSYLSMLPATVNPDPKNNGSMVIFGSGGFTDFSASGIDSGRVVFGTVGSRLTTIQ